MQLAVAPMHFEPMKKIQYHIIIMHTSSFLEKTSNRISNVFRRTMRVSPSECLEPIYANVIYISRVHKTNKIETKTVKKYQELHTILANSQSRFWSSSGRLAWNHHSKMNCMYWSVQITEWNVIKILLNMGSFWKLGHDL